MINEMIKDLEALRGSKVEIFGQPTVLDKEPSDDDLVIDTVKVLENIQNYSTIEEVDNLNFIFDFDGWNKLDEIFLENEETLDSEHDGFYLKSDIDEFLDKFSMDIETFFDLYVEDGTMQVFEDEDGEEYYDISLSDIGEIENDSIEDYLEYIDNIDVLKEIHIGNTYNGGAPVNHHICVIINENISTGEYLIDLKCHRYGDVRCNYTSSALLKTHSISDFYEALYYRKTITFELDLEDDERVVDVYCIINSNDDTMEINIEELNIQDETYYRSSVEEIKEYIITNLL